MSDNMWLAAVLASAVTTGCARPPERPASAPARAPVDVRTAQVEREDGPASAAIPAVVAARDHAALSARVAASVTELPYREGDVVRAGAVVARLHDAALRSAVSAAQAAADAAETDRARVEALLARGAATAREADESRSLSAAARAALEAARENVEYAVLRAPFDGTIARRHVDVGDVVSPGRPIVEVEGRGGLEVRATVEPQVAESLRPGLALQAFVDGQAHAITATVLSLSASADPQTHRFELRATLPASPGLRSGLFARLLVPSPGSEARLMVPSRSLVRRGGLVGVFVVEGSQARLRWVAPGAPHGERTEVRAGLWAGEAVVVDPGPVQDGDPVSARGGDGR